MEIVQTVEREENKIKMIVRKPQIKSVHHLKINVWMKISSFLHHRRRNINPDDFRPSFLYGRSRPARPASQVQRFFAGGGVFFYDVFLPAPEIAPRIIPHGLRCGKGFRIELVIINHLSLVPFDYNVGQKAEKDYLDAGQDENHGRGIAEKSFGIEKPQDTDQNA